MRLPLAVLLAFVCAACTTTNGSGQGTGGSTRPAPPPTSAARKPARSTSSPRAPSSSPPAPAAPTAARVPAGFVPVSTTWVSAAEGWVLGSAPCSQPPCTSIVRTRDGGRSWHGIPAPVAATESTVTGRPGAVTTLRFADASDGWAGVTDLYATHDGGTTWRKQAIAGPVSHIESGGGEVYASVDRCSAADHAQCSTATEVFASPIGHDAWHRIAGPLTTDGAEQDLVVQGASWYLPTAAGVYHGNRTTLLGRLPTPCRKKWGPDRSPAIAVADAQHLDAVCVGLGGMGSAQYRLFGSVDGGHTWRAAGKPFRGASGLDGVSDNAQGVLLLAESSGASVLARTTDDGASFSSPHVRTATGGIPWTDLGFTTATQAVVVLEGKALYLSRDAGRTFDRVRF